MRRISALFAGLVLAACGQGGSQPEKPPLNIMSGLPLFLGEAGPHALLSGTDQRAGIIRLLERSRDPRPLDGLDTNVLGAAPTLMLVQPRLLPGEDLVALDQWVRAGGRLLVFADPLLVWPSTLPLGDARRAPGVTLLDPLFLHWGLSLEPAGHGHEPRPVSIAGHKVRVNGEGRWRSDGTHCALEAGGVMASCRIGRGRAIFIADADLLDHRNWTPLGDQTGELVLALIARLEDGIAE